MVGPKEVFGDKYPIWLERHVMVERQRQWKIRNAENPINALPVEERGDIPETSSIREAFWHSLACECGSCDGDLPKVVKAVRLSIRPIPPGIKSLETRLPPIPYLAQRLLRVALSATLSTEDEPTTPRSERA